MWMLPLCAEKHLYILLPERTKLILFEFSFVMVLRLLIYNLEFQLEIRKNNYFTLLYYIFDMFIDIFIFI